MMSRKQLAWYIGVSAVVLALTVGALAFAVYREGVIWGWWGQ